jgi:hypothetical protein
MAVSTTELEERLAELEQRVDDLPPPADSFIPNFLTIDALGRIGAEFTGAIHATSLVVDGGIEADQLNVGQLSELSDDAGLIVAGIFRGPVFETRAAHPKVRMDSTGVYSTDADGDKVLELVENHPPPRLTTGQGNAQAIPASSTFNDWAGTARNVTIPVGLSLLALGGGTFRNDDATHHATVKLRARVGAVSGPTAEQTMEPQFASGSGGGAGPYSSRESLSGAAFWTNDQPNPVTVSVRLQLAGDPNLSSADAVAASGWLLTMVF